MLLPSFGRKKVEKLKPYNLFSEYSKNNSKWTLKIQSQDDTLCVLMNGEMFGVQEEAEHVRLVWFRVKNIKSTQYLIKLNTTSGFYNPIALDEGYHICVFAVDRGQVVAWDFTGPIVLSDRITRKRDEILLKETIQFKVSSKGLLDPILKIRRFPESRLCSFEIVSADGNELENVFIEGKNFEVVVEHESGASIKCRGSTSSLRMVVFSNDDDLQVFVSLLQHWHTRGWLAVEMSKINEKTCNTTELQATFSASSKSELSKAHCAAGPVPHADVPSCENHDEWLEHTAVMAQVSTLREELARKERIVSKMIDDIGKSEAQLEVARKELSSVRTALAEEQEKNEILTKRCELAKDTAQRLGKENQHLGSSLEMAKASRSAFKTKCRDMEKQIQSILDVTGLQKLCDIGDVLDEQKRLNTVIASREKEKSEILLENAMLRGAVIQVNKKLQEMELSLEGEKARNRVSTLSDRRRESSSSTNTNGGQDRSNSSELSMLANSLTVSLNDANKTIAEKTKENESLVAKIAEMEKRLARFRR